MPRDIDELNNEDEMRTVKMPSGGAYIVHEKEVQYFNDRCRKYQADNHFTNISDLQDLDRLVISELLVWRWGTWVSQNRDYWGDSIDDVALARQIKDHSAEIRQLKKSMGIDKETRDKERGEDSVAAYLASLRHRAREFGYMRDLQFNKGIELSQQLVAIVTLHNNCDDQERREQRCTLADILDWLNTSFIPEFEAVDEHFRTTNQKMWIQSQ